MPTLYCDLDNTLVARTEAFRAWAVRFLAERGHDPKLIDAVMVADGDGLRPKQDTVDELTALLALDESTSGTLLTTFRAGIVANLQLLPGVDDGLRRLREAGWRIGIVTNGAVQQQQAKIDALGLESLVDGIVISDAVGVAKPDPRIFTIAAEQLGQELSARDWMVGDSAQADIVGAQAAGMQSIYLSRGRDWPEGLPRPTAFADSFDDVPRILLAD